MERPKVISLFSGAGGLDYGLEAAGFETAVAVEWDADCCRTLRANRPWPVIEGDIHEVSTESILAAAELARGKVDLVAGGAPCQPFSRSGQWKTGTTKRLDDPRAATLVAYLRVVEEALPRAFIMENVDAFASPKKDEALRLVLDRVAEINKTHGTNYEPRWKILNASEYGVPQLRKRFFLVAERGGVPFSFPAPTHRKDADEDGPLPPPRTTWDALGDLPQDDPSPELAPRGFFADLLPSIPEGSNYLHHTPKGQGEPLFGWRCRYWNFLLKLAKAKPAWTLTAQPGPAVGPFHWKNRRLSVRELCRIQTFPDDVRIEGSPDSAHKQAGNAVPSLLAEVLGRAMLAQFFGRAQASSPCLLPPDRGQPPPPEPVRPVPEKYLERRGDWADHPGHGKGPGKADHTSLKALRKAVKEAGSRRAKQRLVALRIGREAGRKKRVQIPLEELRALCEKLGVYDAANFAQDMKKDGDLFTPVVVDGKRVGWSLTPKGEAEAAAAVGLVTSRSRT